MRRTNKVSVGVESLEGREIPSAMGVPFGVATIHQPTVLPMPKPTGPTLPVTTTSNTPTTPQVS